MNRRNRFWPTAFFACLILAGGALIWWGMSGTEAEPAPEPEVLFNPEDEDTYTGRTPEEAAKVSKDLLETMERTQQLPPSMEGQDPKVLQAATAERVVLVPSLGLVAPLQDSGHTNGWLDLPDPPYATHYNQSADVGADEGASIIASHVDYGYGAGAPFSVLHKIEKGAPIIVKDGDRYFAYKAVGIDLYTRQGLPDDLFRLDGDPLLYLVTCSGPVINDDSRRPFYENNLVVGAEFVEEVDLS